MMMYIDTLLKERARQGNPVRVAMAGCGFMGRGLVNQIVNSVPGMSLSVIAVRSPEMALKALSDAGVDDAVVVDSPAALDKAMSSGRVAVTQDFEAITKADGVDVVIDVTGAVEFGCHLALDCFDNGKHLVLMNAEVDATVGAELGRRADAAGVVFTGCDGDQPGVQMNLIRFVRSIGVTPLVSGNIKGLQDPYRNPTTQEGFAKRWGQDPWMVTSFADGTKMSVEQSIVANAAGLSVHKRGMLGRDHKGHVDELTQMYDIDELREPWWSRRLCRVFQPQPRHLLPRRARRSEAAALPGVVQARQRAALQLLHAVSLVPLRGSDHCRTRVASRRSNRAGTWYPLCRGGHHCQDRSQGRYGTGPARRLSLLRRG